MPVLKLASRVLLWLLIGTGLWSGLRLSYLTLTDVAPCPDIGGLPICYLVALGYTIMLAAQLTPAGKFRDMLFFPAWILVCAIAALGTGFEFAVGETCPKNSSGLPLCYLSLAYSIAIVLLYLIGSRVADRRTSGQNVSEAQ
jgi:hypothetical protein